MYRSILSGLGIHLLGSRVGVNWTQRGAYCGTGSWVIMMLSPGTGVWAQGERTCRRDTERCYRWNSCCSSLKNTLLKTSSYVVCSMARGMSRETTLRGAGGAGSPQGLLPALQQLIANFPEHLNTGAPEWPSLSTVKHLQCVVLSWTHFCQSLPCAGPAPRDTTLSPLSSVTFHGVLGLCPQVMVASRIFLLCSMERSRNQTHWCSRMHRVSLWENFHLKFNY